MKDILFGFLSKTLNVDNEQLAELLYKKSDDGTITEDVNESALQTLLQLDAERVQKLKPNTKDYFDNGYKKGQSETATQWEKRMREKFGVDPDGQLQGEALVDAIKAALSDASTKPEKIKTHPEYLSLEAAMRKQAEELKAQYEAELEKQKAAYSREQTWGQASSVIRQAIGGLNPVLPSDKAKAEKMLDLFINTHFREYDYQPDGNGGWIVMKDGQRVENQHGHVKALQDLVRETAEGYFDFQAQKPAGNAGNANGSGQSVNIKFKDETDYFQQRAAAGGDAQKLKALNDAWKAQGQN
jgi:hypothetical protein